MGKAIIGYVIFFFLCCFGYSYLSDSTLFLEKGKGRMALQLTDHGKFDQVYIRVNGPDGKLLMSKFQDFRHDIFDIPLNAATLEVTRAKEKTPSMVLPVQFDKKNQFRVISDLDPGTPLKKLQPWELYLKDRSILNLIWFFLVILVGAAIGYFVLIISPLSLIAAVITKVLEFFGGVHRSFEGSWFNLLIGLAWLGVGFYFKIPQKMLSMGLYYQCLAGYLIAGYVLYFFAELGFDPEGRQLERANSNAELWAQSENYSYTEWRDKYGNKVKDDKAESAAGAFLGVILTFLLKPLFLPLATYAALFNHYLGPILDGYRSWEWGGVVADETSISEEEEE